MCGFIGVYDRSTDKGYDLDRLVKLIHHRGPDKQNVESVKASYGIAFARLAIIDIDGGAQPMHSQDGSIAVMCNGEIYNYVELRKTLIKAGVKFNTSSDTEVVLRLYEKYGIHLVDDLEGMYAISIIDKKRNVTYLVRDRFGIKPLYYTWTNKGKYAYASEVKPLLRLPFVTKNIRKKSIADFLTYEYIHAPYTVFKDIKKVMPGHYLVLSETGLKDVAYWDCADSKEDTSISIEECKKQIIELMRESLKLHLRSDVKLGCFLSGGIDSGLVTALASEQVSHLDTYTLRFENSDFDESGLAKMVARRYGTNHHCYTVNADDFQKLLAEMTWYFDEPLGDSGILPNYILNRIVNANDTKVILSGAGGDELFAGYAYYFGSKTEQAIAKFPGSAKMVSGMLRHISADLSEKFFRASQLRKDPVAHLVIAEHAFMDGEVKRLCGAVAERTKEYYAARSNGGMLNRLLYTDIKTYLADDLLLLADRSCMAFSVEGRVPFLYRPFVEYAMSLPSEIKAPDGQRKWLLKEVAKEFLPEEVIHAPKMGFCSPIQNWQRLGLGKFAFDILNSPKSTQRDIWNKQEYVKFVSNKDNYSKFFNKIYLLLVLEIFFRIHIDHDYPNPNEIDLEVLYAG